MADSTYNLNFRKAGLYRIKSVELANRYLEQKDWKTVKAQALEENLLQVGKLNTAQSIINVLIERLSALSDDELQQLVDSAPQEQGLYLWLGACRAYPMIADFMTDVVRARIEDNREVISYGDFDSFVMEKATEHPELEGASEYTLYKTKQVLFRLMKESGFFLNKKLVVPVLLPAFVQNVAMNNPDDLLYLPAPADVLKGLAR